MEWSDTALRAGVAVVSLAAGFWYLRHVRQWRASKERFPEGLPKVARAPEEPQHDRVPVPGAEEQWGEEGWLAGFRSVTGAELHTVRYLPDGRQQPRGLVFLWHGMGDHAGTHAHVARAFAEEGYAVYGLDFVGFGRSGGLSGYIRSIDVNVADALRYVDAVVGFSSPEGPSKHLDAGERWRQKVGVPVFIVGQSLGGAHCIRMALARPGAFDGMAVLAPAIGLAGDLNLFLTLVAEVGGTVWPTGPVAKITHGVGSRNPAVTDWETNDPLRTKGYIRFGSVRAIVHSCRKITANLKDLHLPFIVLQGLKDTIVAPNVVDILMKGASTKDKTKKIYSKAWHDLFHEPEAAEVIQTVVKWVVARTKEEGSGALTGAKSSQSGATY